MAFRLAQSILLSTALSVVAANTAATGILAKNAAALGRLAKNAAARSVLAKNTATMGVLAAAVPLAETKQTDNCATARETIKLAQNEPFSPPVLRGLDQNNSASVTEPATQPAINPATQPAIIPQTNSAAQSSPAGQNSQTQTSPVESFFQVPPASKPDPTLRAKPHSKTYKFLWHVMDNAGVPMFGNKDADIDPSLAHPFIMPPLAPDAGRGRGDAAASAGTKPVKPTIIDPEATAQDPPQQTPDDTSSKASSISKPSPNPQ